MWKRWGGAKLHRYSLFCISLSRKNVDFICTRWSKDVFLQAYAFLALYLYSTHSRDKNNFIPIYHTVEWTQFFFLELLFQKYCHNVLTDWNILNDSQWESLMFWCEDIPIVWTFCQLLNGEKFSLESEIISLPHKNFNV